MRFVEVIVVYIILCFLEIVFCTGILSYRKIANACESKKMNIQVQNLFLKVLKILALGKVLKT